MAIRSSWNSQHCAALEAPGQKGRHSRGMRVVLAEGAAHVGSLEKGVTAWGEMMHQIGRAYPIAVVLLPWWTQPVQRLRKGPNWKPAALYACPTTSGSRSAPARPASTLASFPLNPSTPLHMSAIQYQCFRLKTVRRGTRGNVLSI